MADDGWLAEADVENNNNQAHDHLLERSRPVQLLIRKGFISSASVDCLSLTQKMEDHLNFKN